jgi:N6-L-threonylcarbamoyladenine synthase
MSKKNLILGIETSCDETAASIVQSGEKVLSSVVSSQIEIHRPFGGVVPEVACRAHLVNIPYVMEEALNKAKTSLDEVCGIAVTRGPGLVGALLIGINFAKGLSLGLNIPLMGVDHIEAHIYSNKMEHPDLQYPFVSLVVSGGHTSLYFTESPLKYRLLGTTVDDAAGEAFDKVASLLGLSYPGGPSIEGAAKTGNPKAYVFPKTFLSEKDRLEFSFSGIKTSVLYQTRGQDTSRKNSLSDHVVVADVAASFQDSVVEVLVEKTLQAAKKMKVSQAGLGGGVP